MEVPMKLEALESSVLSDSLNIVYVARSTFGALLLNKGLSLSCYCSTLCLVFVLSVFTENALENGLKLQRVP